MATTGTAEFDVPRLQAEHDLAAAGLDAIEQRVDNDNRRLTGRRDDRVLVFALRDEKGRAVGTAAGYSWAGIAELKLMWVDKAYRGVGHGRKLLDAFVAGLPRAARHGYGFRPTTFRRRAGTKRPASSAWPNSADGPKAIPTSSFARR